VPATPPTVAPTVPSEAGGGARGSSIRSTAREWLLLLGPLVLTALVYHPLIRTYFYADDFFDFFCIQNKPLTEYLVCPQGGHLYLTRNSVFYLFFRLFGLHPEPYFWAMLLTHLLNVFLLFVVVRRLTGSSHLAAFGSALWGICPVHADPLGWWAAYGFVLTGTILLFVLLQVAAVAREQRPLTGRDTLLWPALLLVAVTCFGVGIGVTAVSPVVFLLLLPPSRQRTRLCMILGVLALALPFLYHGFFHLCARVSASDAVLIGEHNPIKALSNAPLNLRMLVLLLSYSATSLTSGFLSVQRPFPDALSNVVSGLFVAALVIALVRAPRSTQRQLVAFLLLAVASYGIIAAGRSFFNPERLGWAAATPRYHYIGTIWITIVLCLMLALLGGRLSLRSPVRDLALLGWAGVSLYLYAHAPPFIDLRPYVRSQTAEVLRSVRSAVAAGRPGSNVYVPNKPFLGMGPMFTPHLELFPGWAGVFTLFFPSNVVDGRRVYFVVADPTVIEAHRSGKRTAGLLVPPASGPPLSAAPQRR
jgi:hypothetical protein